LFLTQATYGAANQQCGHLQPLQIYSWFKQFSNALAAFTIDWGLSFAAAM
jgi:hypothetical protein